VSIDSNNRPRDFPPISEFFLREIVVAPPLPLWDASIKEIKERLIEGDLDNSTTVLDFVITPGQNATFHIFEQRLLDIMEKKAIEKKASPKTVDPPRIAETLVSVCLPKRRRDAILGDLDEDFQNRLASGMTLARARRLYWGDALHSIGPLLLAMAKRIGLIGVLADYARRFLH
jgi:hypothetical protein